MNWMNANEIIDGVLRASATTYVVSFLAVLLLFAFGWGLSIWLAPEKDSPSDSLTWPSPPPRTDICEERPIQPPQTTTGSSAPDRV
jgi:hypothetical protein